MPLCISDAAHKILGKKNKVNYLDFYFFAEASFHFPLLGRPGALVMMSPPGHGSEGDIKNDMLILISLDINL